MIRLVILRTLESYFRHRWLYFLPVVLMVIAAGVYIATTDPKYMSTGSIYVQNKSLLNSLTGDNSGFGWKSAAQVTSGEVRELLQTEAFVRAAIKQTWLEEDMSLGPDAVEEAIELYRNSVWVSTGGDNLVIFGANHKSPELTQQMALALVNTFIQWNQNADVRESVVAQTFFSDLIGPYQEELDKAREVMREYLAANPEPLRGERPMEEQMEIGQLQATIDTAESRLASAVEKEEAARLAMKKAESETSQTYTIVDSPELPIKPLTSLRALAVDIAIFIGLGVMLSLLAVIGGVLLDRSYLFPLDVRNGLNLPVLAIVPKVQPQQQPLAVSEPARSGVEQPAAQETLVQNPS